MRSLPGRFEGKLLKMIVRQRGQIICNHLGWGGRALRMRFVVSHPSLER
jgi:hypothetical protein